MGATSGNFFGEEFVEKCEIIKLDGDERSFIEYVIVIVRQFINHYIPDHDCKQKAYDRGEDLATICARLARLKSYILSQ